MKKPRISVIMPVYNGENYLREAIESILNQTFKDFEFIIINDGSTDNSQELIESYSDDRIYLINQSNLGLPKTLNKGIKLARTDFIARMDADDFSMPDRLQLQYSFLEQNVDYVLIGSNAAIMDKNGVFIYQSKMPENWDEIQSSLPQPSFFHSSVMFRKDIAEKCGGYPEHLFFGEERVLFHNMSKYGKMKNLKESLIKYRIVPSSVTYRDEKKHRIIQKLINKQLINETLSEEEKLKLKTVVQTKNQKDAWGGYYLVLAKIYLWHSYQPRQARKNLIKLLDLKRINFTLLCLFFISFLPKKMILLIYNRAKKWKIKSYQ